MAFPLARLGAGAFPPISIASTSLGNIDTAAASSATWSVNVGTGSDRTLIVLATMEDFSDPSTTITGVTVDGNAMTEIVQANITDGGQSDSAAVFAKKLSSESGSVNIVVSSSEVVTSHAMSALILNGVRSITASDTGSGTSTSTTLATSGTVSGPINGIAVGCAAFAFESGSMTWGSSLTERDESATGAGNGDHVHGAAYDLLSSARAASTETVTTSGSLRSALAVASFR